MWEEEVPAQLDKLISAPVDEHPYLKPFKDNKTVSDEDLWVAFTNIRFVMGCQRWYNSNCSITIQKASFTLKICHSMMLKMASWLTGPTHIYIYLKTYTDTNAYMHIYIFSGTCTSFHDDVCIIGWKFPFCDFYHFTFC